MIDPQFECERERVGERDLPGHIANEDEWQQTQLQRGSLFQLLFPRRVIIECQQLLCIPPPESRVPQPTAREPSALDEWFLLLGRGTGRHRRRN